MSAAIVHTEGGGAFRLPGAFMIGMDHIGHTPTGNGFQIYEVRDGDRITFVGE